jgi:hypothetical protein
VSVRPMMSLLESIHQGERGVYYEVPI